MSRGGLMLRCAEAGTPMTYVPLQGALRHGSRPARLSPRPRRSALSSRARVGMPA
jgi:hypothetical protein